jgi:type II secretory pathway component PulM
MRTWTQLGPRDRRALTLGALVLVPALAFSFGVKPYLHARTGLRDRVREQGELLARELALVASARQLSAQLSGASRALASRRSRLFPGHDPLAASATLVSAVGDEARRHGVLLEAIESRAPEAVGGGLVAVQIEVRGRGDLEGLLRWLQALETGPRLLRVEQLSVGRLDTGVPSDSLDVETLTLAAVVRGYLFAGADAGTPDNAIASVEPRP